MHAEGRSHCDIKSQQVCVVLGKQAGSFASASLVDMGSSCSYNGETPPHSPPLPALLSGAPMLPGSEIQPHSSRMILPVSVSAQACDLGLHLAVEWPFVHCWGACVEQQHSPILDVLVPASKGLVAAGVDATLDVSTPKAVYVLAGPLQPATRQHAHHACLGVS